MQTQVTQPDTRLIDTFSQANWDAFRDLLTPDVIYEEPSTQRRTQDADTYVQLCQGWLRALPDGRGVVLRSVHSGDTLVHEVRWEGTHNGPLDTPGGSIPRRAGG
ncbi:ester cyclase [Deinococcus malanensis]|uniref:ester cyclase n=1 Tax=Deinococcus malanensis TaxID=1706855 RepID=UPI00363E1855